MFYIEVPKFLEKIKNRLFFYKIRFEKWIKFNKSRRTIRLFLKRYSKVKKNSQLVLIWDFGGFSAIFSKNAIFSFALRLRGYKTCFVICDGVSHACIQQGLENNLPYELWSEKCSKCISDMKSIAKKYSLRYCVASDFISKDKKAFFKCLSEELHINEILNYTIEGVDVGKLAWGSTIRYMKGFLVDVKDLNKDQEMVFRRYFYSALVNTYVASKIIDNFKPVSVFVSHGVYVDYAPPFVLSFKRGINALSWSSGFANFYHYFLVSKDPKVLKLIVEKNDLLESNLNKKESKRLDDFIFNRYISGGARDLSEMPSIEDKNALKKRLGIDNNYPIVALFAHVNWDYCFDLSDMIFESPNQWVIESVQKMLQIEDVNWIIKVHPGELIDGSLLSTYDLLKSRFLKLPSHIKIIKSDFSVNSYGFYQLIDVGITVFGTVGVELPLFGKPIIAAGDAHFSGKGFSLDAKNKEEYFNYLENIRDIKPLTAEQIKLARQYAYSYFIERQVPLNIIDRKQGHWGDLDLNRLEELLPGKDPVLDKICDCIVNGKTVILDEKELEFIDKKNKELNL